MKFLIFLNIRVKRGTRNKETDVPTTHPYELAHTDLAGPMDPIAKDGFKYLISFTGDCSGCLFTFCLKKSLMQLLVRKDFWQMYPPMGKKKKSQR